MSIASDVAICKVNGFARVKNVFTKQEVSDMRAKAILSMRGSPEVEILKGYPTILYHPSELNEVVNDPRLQEIVKEYYGDVPFHLETQQFYFHLPGDPDEFAWHTDERFRPGVGNLYLQTAILIDDWAEDNSAVEFIKGSHKKPFTNSGDLRKFERNGLKGSKLFGEAGDVFTWSNTVVHGSESNQGKTSRMYFMHGFRGTQLSEC